MRNKCPWCETKLCEFSYEGTLPEDVEELESNQECPNCGKLLKFEIEEKTVTTYEISISEGRTKADLAYLAWKKERDVATTPPHQDKGE